jgi:hypothetical protein
VVIIDEYDGVYGTQIDKLGSTHTHRIGDGKYGSIYMFCIHKYGDLYMSCSDKYEGVHIHRISS